MNLQYAVVFISLISISPFIRSESCLNGESDERIIRRTRDIGSKFSGRPLADRSSSEENVKNASNEEKCPQRINLWQDLLRGFPFNELSQRPSWGFGLRNNLNRTERPSGQWWDGPNVCKNVEEQRKELAGDGPHIENRFIFKQFCQHTAKSYKCVLSTVENNTEITRTTNYECCLGFRRKAGALGCPEKLDLKSLKDTLHSLNATRFLDAMKNAGLLEILDSNANYTIFAPSDEAFANDKHDPADVSVVALEDSNFARDTLSAHIVKGWQDLESMEDEQNLPTLKQGSDIQAVFYSIPHPMALANCAKITKADVQATNGYVQVVDRILPQASKTLLTMLQEDSRLSTFTSLLDEQTRKLLNDEDKRYTVFAFTDQSFENLPTYVRDRFKAKLGCVSDVAHHHILPMTICSAVLNGLLSAQSLSKRHLLFNASDSNDIRLNGNKLINKDRVAKNGVLNVIDGVLTFPQNQDMLSVLDSMGYGQMASLLKQNGAIEQKLASSNDTILLLPPLHIVENILSSNYTDEEKNKRVANYLVEYVDAHTVQSFAGQRFETRAGESGRSIFSPSAPETVGCAIVVDNVVNSCTGQIKLIDGALPIPTVSVADFINNEPEFSEFNELLKNSSLDADLRRSDKAFTVFVPTNRAMSSISPEDRELLKNPDEMKKFVRKHIVDERLCCHRFTSAGWFGEGPKFESEAGTMLNSARSVFGQLWIGHSRVLLCNQEAINGVVHTIDRPFVPHRPSSPFRHFRFDW